MKINNQTRLIGIIGNPVEHSFSPAMHNPVLAKMEMNCIYLPFLVEPKRIGDAVAGIRALNLLGVNVTVPYKQSVIEYLDKLSPEALACGAVNLIKNDDGCLMGFNTDGLGFIASLEEYGVESIENTIILGAGGAAYAVAVVLASAGCKHLTILDLDPVKACQLASFVAGGRECVCKGVEVDEVLFDQVSKNANLIVNCTPVGMYPDVYRSPVNSLAGVKASAVVYDLIYNPGRTCFLSMAEEQGLKTINGLAMLIHQGALTLEILTGIKPPLQYMKEVVDHSIKKR